MRGASLEASVDFLADELEGWAALYETGLDAVDLSTPDILFKERAHTYKVISRMLRQMVDDSRPLPVSDG